VARTSSKIRQHLVIAGSAKPQIQRAPSRNSWTPKKEREFLAVLGETCNVTRACEAAGMSKNGAYKRRRKNAAFRAAWLETISAAYQQLELVLLEAGRAFFAGHFPELEAELGGMIAGGGYEGPRSPDRADAMVWAMTALSVTKSGVPRVRRL